MICVFFTRHFSTEDRDIGIYLPSGRRTPGLEYFQRCENHRNWSFARTSWRKQTCEGEFCLSASLEFKLHSLENGRTKPSMWCHVFQLYEKAGSFEELICMHVCQKLNIDTLCNCFYHQDDHFSNSNERQSLCKVCMALLWKHRNGFWLELVCTILPALRLAGILVWKCHKTPNLHS